MKLLKRILTWTALTIVVLAIGGLIIAWFVDSRQSDQELAEEFKGQRIQPTVHYYRVSNRHSNGTSRDEAPRTIRFIETPASPADSALPVVIFVHGAPSSLSFFNAFFKDTTLLNRARLVAVDRPGYGYSDYGRVETSIIRQAELLQPLIDR